MSEESITFWLQWRKDFINTQAQLQHFQSHPRNKSTTKTSTYRKWLRDSSNSITRLFRLSKNTKFHIQRRWGRESRMEKVVDIRKANVHKKFCSDLLRAKKRRVYISAFGVFVLSWQITNSFNKSICTKNNRISYVLATVNRSHGVAGEIWGIWRPH